MQCVRHTEQCAIKLVCLSILLFCRTKQVSTEVTLRLVLASIRFEILKHLAAILTKDLSWTSSVSPNERRDSTLK
jgi:hypothetical protein